MTKMRRSRFKPSDDWLLQKISLTLIYNPNDWSSVVWIGVGVLLEMKVVECKQIDDGRSAVLYAFKG
jgi:hypothetical protein